MDSPLFLATTGVLSLAVSYLLYSKFSSSSSSSSSSTDASSSAAGASSSNKDKSSVLPKINVYFGSQTGTAEGFARQLEAEAESNSFQVIVKDLEDFDQDSAEDEIDDMKDAKVNVFLMATYGEGEPTDNAAEFVKIINPSKKSDDMPPDLMGVDFAVFGLGNTQYEFYNAMGKLADRQLEALGGNRTLPLGVGDDDKTMEEDWEAWKEKFWASVMPRGQRARSESNAAPPKVKINFTLKPATEGSKPAAVPKDHQQPSTRYYFDSHDCAVSANRELRSPADGGSTRHVEVSLPPGVSYNTADNAAVLAHNDPKVVEAVAKALGLNLGEAFELVPNDGKHVFPTPCSVKDLLTKYTDLTGPLRRADLKALSAYCKDPVDAKALVRLASKEGKDEYVDKIEKPMVSLHVLCTEMIKSLHMTTADVIAATSRLQPRYYTISSSSTAHPRSVHMTVGVIEGTSAAGRPYAGVASKYLQTATRCTVFVKESSFKLPKDNKTPIVMIGPGTGIAPMRALLQEREARGGCGENILYFGCKNRTQDYIYRDELEAFEERGVLTKLHLAFSREQAHKVYVQNLMEGNAGEIWDMVEAGAYFYVCGATNMGKAVVDVIKGIGEKNGRPDLIKELQKEDRLVQELWSA